MDARAEREDAQSSGTLGGLQLGSKIILLEELLVLGLEQSITRAGLGEDEESHGVRVGEWECWLGLSLAGWGEGEKSCREPPSVEKKAARRETTNFFSTRPMGQGARAESGIVRHVWRPRLEALRGCGKPASTDPRRAAPPPRARTIPQLSTMSLRLPRSLTSSLSALRISPSST